MCIVTVIGDVSIVANNAIFRMASKYYVEEEDKHLFRDNAHVEIENDNKTFKSSSTNFTRAYIKNIEPWL